MILSSTSERLVLPDMSIHISKNYNVRHQKWWAIISPQMPRGGLPVTVTCKHQQLRAPSGLENTTLLQSVQRIHVPTIRHIPIIFHDITAEQLHMFRAITSMPKSTTHCSFPSHRVPRSAATSGTTMLNFVFGYIPCAWDMSSSGTVLPRPLGFCSVTTRGTFKILDVWTCKIENSY